jgi:hypothetical protein
MYKHTTNSSGLLTPRGQRGGGVDMSLGLRQTGSAATAIISPAKNALTQKNTRISSAFFMTSSSSNDERDGGAKAALLQSFADSGVRPVLKGRIKSNQFPEMGPALFDPDGNLEQQAEGLGEPDHDKAASYRSDRDAVITQSNLKL